MPLVLAAVGTLGTYLVTDQQRQATEARAVADRQIKILEIISDKIASPDENERIFALWLTLSLDSKLAVKLLPALSTHEQKSAEFKKALEDVTKAIVWSVDAPKAAIEGRCNLRHHGELECEPVNWLEMKVDGRDLRVKGDAWEGDVTFNGTRGYYDWTFKTGKQGHTDIYLDEQGILLFGIVKGKDEDPRTDWTYWGTRETAPNRADEE